MSEEGRCAACESPGLVPHLSVSGEIGSEGLIPTTDSFGTALSDIIRCSECGHRQLRDFPSAESLSEAYGEAESDDYVIEERGQRATAAAILGRIEVHAERGALLDLGCWVGFLLAEARDRGWSGFGVEPSAFASGYAREQLGLDVVTADLDTVELSSGRFQAAFMGDVIEHLIDPAAALDRVAGALAPGGILALTLPDAGSRVARAMGQRWWAVIPTHVQYFTRRSLGTLLARRGFEPLLFSNAPKAFTVGYYLGRAGGYSPALAGALVGSAKALGIADRIWAPDFGDRMLVIARAPR
ncbi:MAG: class I SAM-dependent methyltransferase [Actinomycetota bacterium]|nr:class I SAM-dependent methyltransferase [Actinomycetota bacterium]